MRTAEAVSRFLTKCQERGLSEASIRGYYTRLKAFTSACPELPTQTAKIEAYLKLRGESPAKRGNNFNTLQALYSYLEQYEDLQSPIPSRGKVGRPGTKTRRDKVKAEVEEALRELGVSGSPEGRTVSDPAAPILTKDAIARFVASRRAQGITPKTEEKYRTTFNAFAARFNELPRDPETLEDYIRRYKGSPETRWTHQITIKSLYNFLAKRDGITNPFEHIAPVKVPRKVRPTLELDQLRALLALDLTVPDRALLTLLMDNGLRMGEIISLDREHIQEDHIKVTGKTGEHLVPISPETRDLLRSLQASGPLFRGPKGRITKNYIYIHISKLLERIGYTGKKHGPHLLRHSFGRHYMALGGDLMSLKEILGHTRVTTTQVYAALSFSDVKKRHGEQSVLGKLNGGENVY